MTVLHLTTAYDDILRGHIALSTIAVASALDGYAVIASIEETILDQHAITAFWIAAVTIGAVVDHLHSTHCDVSRMEGMDHPERRAQQGNILQQDAFTLVERHKLRPQTILRTKASLRCALTFLIIHRYAVLAVLQKSGS